LRQKKYETLSCIKLLVVETIDKRQPAKVIVARTRKGRRGLQFRVSDWFEEASLLFRRSWFGGRGDCGFIDTLT
jgi:hypothetical protein